MDKFMLKGLKEKLPVFPGINGKEDYFNSAVLVLLMLINDEYHFVFEKRAAAIRSAGEICFPGGKFDPEHDASFRDTAIRETTEELGVQAEKLSIIGQLDTVFANMGVSVDAFLGIIDIESLGELRINCYEVEKVFTIPVSYFENSAPEVYKVNIVVHPTTYNEAGEEVLLLPVKELGLPERYTRPWGNIKSNIYVYKIEDVTIWGITARIIKDVIAKIKSL
ncbi:MAG: CoA pyrophosphatase [Bacillota bacterium]|nr:CoA pyrophosphatase [Bacillota bacterium]